MAPDALPQAAQITAARLNGAGTTKKPRQPVMYAAVSE
jgi:hypothetical protein